MKNLFSFLTALPTAIVLTSCAYEKDPGLQPKKDPNGKPAVNDVLNGKSSADILNIKYKNLKASCELKLVTVAPATALETAEAVPQDVGVNPPAPPVVNEGNKTSYDIKAQLAVDPTLAKNVEAVMVEAQGGTELTLKLDVKPVIFATGLNLKFDKLVYVMKYSPVMTFEYTYTEQSPVGDRSSVKGKGSLNENIASEVLLKSIENADKSVVNHVLKCELKSEVNPDNNDVKGQWIKVDCSQKPEPGKEAEHAANCKEGVMAPQSPVVVK